MAGTNPDFNAAEFRDGIRFAMEMGADPDTSLDHQATFYFPAQLVYTGPADDEGVPFDPNTSVTRVEPQPVQVPCAIEFRNDKGESLAWGAVNATHISITLLDEDHAQVEGCHHVVVGGDTYYYRSTAPPSGLFDVGLYVLHFAAAQET